MIMQLGYIGKAWGILRSCGRRWRSRCGGCWRGFSGGWGRQTAPRKRMGSSTRPVSFPRRRESRATVGNRFHRQPGCPLTTCGHDEQGHPRHSREGGNPVCQTANIAYQWSGCPLTACGHDTFIITPPLLHLSPIAQTSPADRAPCPPPCTARKCAASC